MRSDLLALSKVIRDKRATVRNRRKSLRDWQILYKNNPERYSKLISNNEHSIKESMTGIKNLEKRRRSLRAEYFDKRNKLKILTLREGS